MSFFTRLVLSLGLSVIKWWRTLRGVLVALAVVALVAAGVYLSGSRVGDIRARAPEVLRRAGFEVVGSEGYRPALLSGYGGVVLFIVQRTVDPGGHLYELGVSRWGSEYHLWDVRCLDCCPGGERR